MTSIEYLEGMVGENRILVSERFFACRSPFSASAVLRRGVRGHAFSLSSVPVCFFVPLFSAADGSRQAVFFLTGRRERPEQAISAMPDKHSLWKNIAGDFCQ